MAKQSKPSFFRDTSGNLSIISGVVGLLLLTAVGASLDGGRMFTTKQQLQSITDAAALMATQPEDIDKSARVSMAETSISNHVEQIGGLNITGTEIDVRDNGKQVYVSLTASVPMLFGGVLGEDIRQVSVSSLAEETSSSSSFPQSVQSMSIVLDLSESMDDKLEQETRLQMVRSTMSDYLASRSSGALSTGLYPFNWGIVDAQTIPLQLGSADVIRGLTASGTREGSAPASAMEMAVNDQLNDTNGDRFLIYITDGSVDIDKADERGRYLRDSQIFGNNAPALCRNTPPDLLRAQDELAEDLLTSVADFGLALTGWTGPGAFDDDKVKYDSNDSIAEGQAKRKLLLQLSAETIVRDGNLSGTSLSLTSGLVNFNNIGNSLANTLNILLGSRDTLVEEQNEFDRICKPIQEQRVIDACEAARDDGVRVVAVNLSDEHGAAAPITQDCVFGARDVSANGTTDTTIFPYRDATPVRQNSDGITTQFNSQDGSVYAVVSNRNELRAVLDSLMPSQVNNAERTVRLVH